MESATPASGRSSYEIPILRVENLKVFYGERCVIHGISLEVPAGSFSCITGLPGSGKTTLLRGIMGLARTKGLISLGSTRLDRLPPYKRGRLGLAYMSQDKPVFPGLTVRENLTVSRSPDLEVLNSLFELLPFLRKRAGQKASTLDDDERKLLGLASVLVTKPKMALLDEPITGISPTASDIALRAMRDFVRGGTGFLVVGRDVELFADLCEETSVIDSGKLKAF